MKLKLALILLVIGGCSESKEARVQKFLLKGNLMVKDQNLDQAAYYFKEALNLDPCFADAANNLGTVYFKLKRWDLAMQQYEIFSLLQFVAFTKHNAFTNFTWIHFRQVQWPSLKVHSINFNFDRFGFQRRPWNFQTQMAQSSMTYFNW